MAVIGRTKSQRYLAAQAAMLASMSALPRAKNNLASVSRLWPRLRDRTWVISAQWPGGNSDLGPSAQYSAVTFWRSLRFEVKAARLSMCLGSKLFRSRSGPGTANWKRKLSTSVRQVDHWGVVATCGEPVPSGTRSG